MILAVLQTRMSSTRLPGNVQEWLVSALYPANRAFTSVDIEASVAKHHDLANCGGDRRG